MIYTHSIWMLMVLSCGAALLLPLARSSAAVFAALFLYALALGMEYPVINRIYREDEGGARAAGILHSMDHLGAALATLLGGTLLLPLAGSRSILLLVACVHIALLSGLVMSFEEKRR